MRLTSRLLQLALAATPLADSTVAAQTAPAVLTISVVDAATTQALAGVEVRVDSARFARTGGDGSAAIRLTRGGVVQVRVRKLGYVSQEFSAEVETDSATISVPLDRVTVFEDTIRVREQRLPPRLQAFAFRQRLGVGRFLNSLQLMDVAKRPLWDALSQKLPGLRAVYGPHNSTYRLVTQREGSPCAVRVVYDDIDVASDLRGINVSDVAAVEFYSATNAPAQFRDPRVRCGVVLLWSSR